MARVGMNLLNLSKLSTYLCLLAFFLVAVPKTGVAADGILAGELESTVYPAAERMCGSFSQHGTNIQAEAKLAAEAGLKGLWTKFVGGKASASLAGTVDWYSNVLQKDLLQNNKDLRECKLIVFKRLLDFIEKARQEKNRASQLEGAAASQMARLSPGTCSNSIYMYRTSEGGASFVAQAIWQCKDFGTRRVAANKAGLSPPDAMFIDSHRGKIEISGETTSLLWGISPKKLLTVRIRNVGPVSVRVDSIEVLQSSIRAKAAWPDLIRDSFVIFPSEEVVVPAVDIAVLSRAVHGQYDEERYKYAVKTVSAGGCDLPSGFSGSCSSSSRGFALSVKYTDVFSDRYQLNKAEYLVAQETVASAPVQIRVD